MNFNGSDQAIFDIINLMHNLTLTNTGIIKLNLN